MRKKLTLEEFIKRSKEVHNNKYDYSKTEYIDTKTKVCVICPIHGKFYVTPAHHFKGVGCPKCAGRLKSNEEVISQFVKVHGNKYDYSKVEYKGAKEKVCIICPKHGEFWQKPCYHLDGNGCPHCRKLGMNNETFIKRAKKIHGDKYDYTELEYKGCRNYVKIKCKEHGVFKQMPYKHLQGCGCPYCNESHLEKKIKSFLDLNNIKYIYQCNKNTLMWLGKQSLDFYLPDYSVAIECQGIQHYIPINYFGGEKKFEYIKKLDDKKKKLCEQNKIKLIYFGYKENDTNKLLKII